MDSSDILKGFNNHVEEFFNEIEECFPDSEGIKYSKIGFEKLRKANPKLLIGFFKNYFYIYKDEILKNNLETFVTKDYNYDLRNVEIAKREYIIKQIDLLRQPILIAIESNKNRDCVIKYFKNFISLCEIYYNLN